MITFVCLWESSALHDTSVHCGHYSLPVSDHKQTHNQDWNAVWSTVWKDIFAQLAHIENVALSLERRSVTAYMLSNSFIQWFEWL